MRKSKVSIQSFEEIMFPWKIKRTRGFNVKCLMKKVHGLNDAMFTELLTRIDGEDNMRIS